MLKKPWRHKDHEDEYLNDSHRKEFKVSLYYNTAPSFCCFIPSQISYIITSSFSKVSYYVYSFKLIYYLYIQEVTSAIYAISILAYFVLKRRKIWASFSRGISNQYLHSWLLYLYHNVASIVSFMGVEVYSKMEILYTAYNNTPTNFMLILSTKWVW